MVLGQLVECGGNDLAANAAPHIGDFFRALVDQKNDQVRVGIIGRDPRGDLL